MTKSVLAILLFGCGDNGNRDIADGPVGGRVDGGLPIDGRVDAPNNDDYATGVWSFTNLSDSPGTISHDGMIVQRGAELFAVYAEPDAVTLEWQDVVALDVATLTRTSLQPNPSVQFAFPAVATDGATDVVVYNGYGPTTWNDLWVRTRTGGTWTPAQNLTAPIGSMGSTEFDHYNAALAATDNGYALTFLRVEKTSGFDAGEVMIAELTAQGAMTGTPTPVYAPAPGQLCSRPAVVVGADDVIHVVVTCGGNGAVIYANNQSGLFIAEQLVAPADCTGSALALGQDRQTLHAAWSCGGGIGYRRRVAGTWEPAVTVAPIGNNHSPTVAEDAEGRALVAYHRFTDGWGDVFFAWSTAGTFTERNLTPGTADDDDYFPASMLTDAAGRVHFVYDRARVVGGSFNRDVWLASF